MEFLISDIATKFETSTTMIIGLIGLGVATIAMFLIALI